MLWTDNLWWYHSYEMTNSALITTETRDWSLNDQLTKLGGLVNPIVNLFVGIPYHFFRGKQQQNQDCQICSKSHQTAKLKSDWSESTLHQHSHSQLPTHRIVQQTKSRQCCGINDRDLRRIVRFVSFPNLNIPFYYGAFWGQHVFSFFLIHVNIGVGRRPIC